MIEFTTSCTVEKESEESRKTDYIAKQLEIAIICKKIELEELEEDLERYIKTGMSYKF